MRTAPRMLLLSLLLALEGAAQVPPSAGRAPSQAVPGLGLLRPEALRGLERQLGVASLAALPTYEIDQALDDVTGTFQARMVLRYTNNTRAPMAALPFLLHPNAAADLNAGGNGGGTLQVDDVTALEGPAVTRDVVRPGLLEVRFASPVQPGARVTLALRYGGRFRTLPPGTNDMLTQSMRAVGTMTSPGSTDYGLLAVGDGIVTMASAYPMAAPFHDGAFDTTAPSRVGDLAYNDVANFRLRTVVPRDLTVVTNLVDQAPVEHGAGARVVTSEGALVRDLILVGGRDLRRQSVTVGATRVTSVFRARDAEGGRVALETAAASLRSFERRFGPYPYTELDVAEASLVGGAGGVEFCGMVLIAGMLYRPVERSESQLATLLRLFSGLQNLFEGHGGRPPAPPAPAQVLELLRGQLEFTVAHEVAHQYFAGLVGNDSHRFPAVDEPLAQYAAGLVVEDLHGAAAARSAMDQNVRMNYALYRLLGGADRPVLRDTSTYRTPIEYGGLVYGKAPYAYVELRRSLGDARLHASIGRAVQDHRFRLATYESWVGALERGAGGPSSGVRAAFHRAMEEAHGDQDLGVDDSGEWVLRTLFPPEVASTLRSALPAVGMSPRDLLRMTFGGALQDDAPVGAGIDPSRLLRTLPPLQLGP
ncbi:MAG: hypothetical protein HY909_26960 [Deltaproteobacteria bacterium]|nr:hypothetical protein [Deltaproteobacteria bacterium]